MAQSPPDCFNHPTMVKGKDAYLGVTGEDDLLETPAGKSHLLRGDMRPTLGTEVVVLGPLFIFSVCRGHRIGHPWPMTATTSTISKNTPDRSNAQLSFRRNHTELYCFSQWESLQRSTRGSSYLGHSVKKKKTKNPSALKHKDRLLLVILQKANNGTRLWSWTYRSWNEYQDIQSLLKKKKAIGGCKTGSWGP